MSDRHGNAKPYWYIRWQEARANALRRQFKEAPHTGQVSLLPQITEGEIEAILAPHKRVRYGRTTYTFNRNP